jgi:hypothetical protein
MLITIFFLTLTFWAASVIAYVNPPRPLPTPVEPIIEDEDPPTEVIDRSGGGH